MNHGIIASSVFSDVSNSVKPASELLALTSADPKKEIMS
jgi:hypothetical protein